MRALVLPPTLASHLAVEQQVHDEQRDTEGEQVQDHGVQHRTSLHRDT
jgi:hypothetical protein